eukprot:Transcript_23577.p1 GENE.Transcript_23577~~Transcript_23577.p1  ORF type:complete len:368 (+),score=100.30 Transcript_23577:92-1105(+)
MSARSITEEELFAELAAGSFQSVVVVTGAGVSTAAGISDFRSAGGLFDQITARWAERYPFVLGSPEQLLSRQFARQHASAWAEEVQPWLRELKGWADAQPQAAHRFCAWLHRRGMLRRVYTQNVDGLHTHPSLGLPAELVVEVHGNLFDNSLVLYGDQVRPRLATCAAADFSERRRGGDGPPVDLVLVMGTSLQVAPFCALPNLAPPGCTRVLVNRRLADALTNDWCAPAHGGLDAAAGLYDSGGLYGGGLARLSSSIKLAGRPVTLRPKWGREGKVWRQLLVEDECEAFLGRMCASHATSLDPPRPCCCFSCLREQHEGSRVEADVACTSAEEFSY